MPCLQEWQSGSGAALDGGMGNETPGRHLSELLLSESLDDPVFANMALKMIQFFFPQCSFESGGSHMGLYAGHKKKTTQSPAMYVSVFLT